LNCVIDSCVWISAFQFGGTPFDALHLISEEHRLLVCTQIVHEIRTALKGRFRWSEARLDSVLSEFRASLVQVETPGRLHGVCRDPNDDVIIECAVMGDADLIVTGDKDLLAVGNYKGVRILTPREFLNEFATPES